jgi:hypothetical protein
MLKKSSIAFLICVSLTLFAATANARQLDIRWENKKLTIKARDVSLCETLKYLGEKTNTEILNSTPCNALVNIDINNSSFEDGVKRLLRNGNYVLVVNENVRKLLILDKDANPAGKNHNRGSEERYEQYIPPEPPPFTTTDPQYQDQYSQPPDAVAPSQDADIPPEPVNQSIPDAPVPYPTEPPIDPQMEQQGAN